MSNLELAFTAAILGGTAVVAFVVYTWLLLDHLKRYTRQEVLDAKQDVREYVREQNK